MDASEVRRIMESPEYLELEKYPNDFPLAIPEVPAVLPRRRDGVEYSVRTVLSWIHQGVEVNGEVVALTATKGRPRVIERRHISAFFHHLDVLYQNPSKSAA